MLITSDVQMRAWGHIGLFNTRALSEAALIMRKHMETYGTTAEQLGTVAVAQRKNACQNPNAYLQKPLTMDEYLNSPMIAEPVRMLDAVIPINAAYPYL